MKKQLISVFIYTIASSAILASSASIDKLATKIVGLRSEVESLNTEHLALKTELTNELKAKGARAAQLESQMMSEEVRQKQILEKIKVLKKELTNVTGTTDEFKPFVLETIEKNIQRIESGIPFKTKGRLADINKIKEKLESGLMTSEAALGRLWAHLEDEMRLTRENALHRQVINIEGNEVLATVAKLGMVSLFFHTEDNTVGNIVFDKKSKSYSYMVVKKKDEKEAILNLVSGLKKQIRHGEYVIPWTININETKSL